MPPRLRAIYLLFAISGFCGLIYESIWAKYLKLFLGHAAYAQTVVLVVFIGGMAIGAALCAKFTNRIRHPLIAYAIVEFIVGVFAIGFHRYFVGATDWAYTTLLPATCDATSFCISSWALAAGMILPQSILLGMTFPLMTAGVLRAYPETPGRKLSLLYFLNSFGAVFGVLASTFVLVPWVGMPGTTLTAGLMNVALAFIMFAIVRGRTSNAPLAARPGETLAIDSELDLQWLVAIAFLTGLSSFIYEIVWIRMLAMVMGSSTHAFELMLASFILGLALGGLWVRRVIDTTTNPTRFLGIVQILMGLLALASIPLYNLSFDAMEWMLRALARDDSSYVLFNVGSSLLSMGIMLPATFLAGMTLPLITYLLLQRGVGERSIGMIYSANTFGSIAGVLIGIHIGLPLLGVQNGLKLAAAIDVLLGIGILSKLRNRRTVAVGWIALASVAMIAGSLTFHIDLLRTASGVYRFARARLNAGDQIVFHRDGKTATVDTVRFRDQVVAILTNGKADASIQMGKGANQPALDEFTMVLAAVLPLAYRPEIATAAAIGFGSGLTTATLLASPNIQRVDTIEIEPAMVDGARHFLPWVSRAYSDRRSRIIFDDAKSFFARGKERYDLIVSEPSNPWVSGTSSLFTQEFYSRIRGYLNDHGLYVQWIQAYDFNAALLASIVNALASAFPDFVVYSSHSDLIIIASKTAGLGEPSPQMFEWPQLANELGRLGISNMVDVRSRRLAGGRTLANLLARERVPPNSDYFPYVDLEAPRARFKRETAAGILNLGVAPLPVVEIIERWAPDAGERASQTPNPNLERQRLARQADDLMAFLSDLKPADSRLVPSNLDASLVSAFRLTLLDCTSLPNTAALWDRVVQLGALFGAVGGAATSERFWRNAGASPCLRNLPPYYSDWISLLRSVSARDPRAIEQTAESLLEYPDKTTHQIEYLVLASVTGALAQGKTQEAKSTLTAALPALSPQSRELAWFALVQRLAGI